MIFAQFVIRHFARLEESCSRTQYTVYNVHVWRIEYFPGFCFLRLEGSQHPADYLSFLLRQWLLCRAADGTVRMERSDSTTTVVP